MTPIPRQQERFFARMRDVALGLWGASSYNQKLSRIQLQKLIYLTDAISTLFDMLPPQVAHETYKHGPWDNVIQNAADCLVFRGMANVDVQRDSADGKTFCRYSISRSGEGWAESLRASGAGERRWEATSAVCEQVNNLGWRRLRRLAYAEPAYVSARQIGFGQELKPYAFVDVSTGALLEVLRMALSPTWNNSAPTAAMLTELYFAFLDRYDQQSQTDLQEG